MPIYFVHGSIVEKRNLSANLDGQDSGNHVTFEDSANKTSVLFGPSHWALAAFLTLVSTAKGNPPLTQRTFHCGGHIRPSYHRIYTE